MQFDRPSSSPAKFPAKFLVVDEFLPAPFHADLLTYAVERQTAFEPAQVLRDGAEVIEPGQRISAHCRDGLGPHKERFRQAILARFAEFPAALGLPHFEVARVETQLVAHGDGAFYKPHIDTHTGLGGKAEETVRVLSLVYYFHRAPKAFSGGEIALFPFGDSGDPVLVEPRDNRLLAFPSFAEHEVRTVSCPSRQFADSRFAINCWLRRQ